MKGEGMRKIRLIKGISGFAAVLAAMVCLIPPLVFPCHAGDDIVMDPGAARQWITNGMIHFRERDFKRATECLERAIMIDPGNADAQALLSEIMTIAVSELKSRGSDISVPSAASADNSSAKAPVAAPPLKSGRERRGSILGSFLGGRGRSGGKKNSASNPSQQSGVVSKGTQSLFVPGSSFVSSKRDPKVSRAIEEAMGGTGGFKLLSGYLERPVDRSGFASGHLASGAGSQDREPGRALPPAGAASAMRETRIEECNEKGLALARKNRFREAIKHFGEALELDPGNLVAMSNMALAHAYNDDLYSAIKVYRKIITLTPPGSKYHQLAKNMIDKLKTLI